MSLNTNTNSAIYGMYDLDAVDHKIIEYLRQNGREPYARIAEEMGLPPSTVRDRTNRMMDSGVLQIVAVVTPAKKPRQVMAGLGVKLAGGRYKGIAAEISKMKEVSYLVMCAGRFDLMVELTCDDNAHLLETISKIQSMPHVQETETSIYFSIVKEMTDIGPKNL